MTRKVCVDKNGMKKGAWSEEEDDKLRSYILRYGHWNWRLLPKFAGLARCGKSCRLRWMNYLKPGLKRGSFTKEEEHLISKLHDELGKKWSAIAARIPGRSDNEIKNFWHTHLKKRSSKSKTNASSPRISVCKDNAINSGLAQESSANFQTTDKQHVGDSESSGTSNSPKVSASSSQYSGHEVEETYNMLLSQEQLVIAQNWSLININDNKYERGNSSLSSDGFEASFWTEPFLMDTQDHSFSPLMEPEEAAIYLFT